LTPEWIKHFTTTTPTGRPGLSSALSCTVTVEGEGNIVYVAGVVQDGAVMDNADISQSRGDDDIFVIQMDGASGDVSWFKQIGTKGKENLAKGGALDVDNFGNLIVLAETTGSMYTTRPDNASKDAPDMVVFSMDKKTGEYKQLTEHAGGTGGGSSTNAPVGAPVDNFAPTPILADDIVALQTGPSAGPMYAGGLAYDRFTNAIYVTGAVYGDFPDSGKWASKSSCFFGSLVLPRLSWREKSSYGSGFANEACNAVSLARFNNQVSAIVVGSTEPNGLLTELSAQVDVHQYGFALDIRGSGSQFDLNGGAIMDENKVQFPITTIADKDKIYIVSMVSKDTKVTADFSKVRQNRFPNLTTGGIEKYGDNYSILVERHTAQAPITNGLTTTLSLDWRRPFQTADGAAVFVSGMIAVGDELVVVGSTRGRPDSTDMDGIMAKVDPSNGQFATDGFGSKTVAYFASSSDRDDWVLNACADPDDDTVFYVVGATAGNLDNGQSKGDTAVHAVVAKISLSSLTAIWTKQFPVSPAPGQSRDQSAAGAYGCAVIDGQGEMYVAGNVENGATIQNGDSSTSAAGRDDIWVAKLKTSSGQTSWLRQVGSNGDDRLAHGGGVAADANGNAVLYGDTNGSFYRQRSDDKNKAFSDVFVFVMDQRDGAHLPPLKGEALPLGPTANEFFPEEKSKSKTGLFAAIAVLLLLLIGAFFVVTRRRERKRSENQRSSIFGYLQQFDVEDIDLRKSPPGGWHGTYLNRLAYGINKDDGGVGTLDDDVDDTTLDAGPSFTHSSVVRDSLFMDTTSTPSLGYRDGPSDSLDAYGGSVSNRPSYSDNVSSNNLHGKEVI